MRSRLLFAAAAGLVATNALAFERAREKRLPDALPRGSAALNRQPLPQIAGWERVGGLAFGPGVEVPDVRAFAGSHPELFAGDELTPRTPAPAGRYQVVVLDQSVNGIPVEGARADLRFFGGQLVQVRSLLADDLGAVATTPRLDAARALALAPDAARTAGREPAGAATIDLDRPLAVVRGAGEWRLAWRAHLDVSDPVGRLTLWIDAIDGSILAARDEYRYGATTLAVSGSHEPRRAGDALVVSPYARLGVEQSDGQEALTGSAGLATLAFGGAAATETLQLRGSITKIRLYIGSSASATIGVSDATPASFEWDDSTARLTERDAYASHAVVHARMETMAPDVAWLDTQLDLIVDVPDGTGCNAYWDGTNIVFYAESAQCNATSRIADVVYHETGHGLHQHLSSGGFLAPDVGEGSADYLAATITGDPEIGPSFFKATGAGLRSLDNAFHYPEDVSGEPHHDGQMWGGSFWNLRKSLVASLGTDAGVALSDRIDADTLRLDPTLAGGFWDVLAADDDDGAIGNGTPHDCAIVQAFGAHGLGPGDGLSVSHDPVGEQSAARAGYPVRMHVAGPFLRCANAGIQGATLSWRAGGSGDFHDLPMGDDLVPGWKVATIPPQPAGARVEYRLAASDTVGRTVSLPRYNGESEPFAFIVGEPRVLFADDFEVDRGWTHRLIEGDVVLGADDWERGPSAGLAGDPPQAWSGTNVLGNDLGAGGFDGLYQPRIVNRATSPSIDARGATGVHLSFRRWLNVEPGDRARVLVNGHEIWSNPVDETIRDRAWRFEDYDVSRVADGRRLRVEFELATNSTNQMGGWTLDDVAVTATGTQEVSPGCGCDLGGGQGAILPGAILALVALSAQRRRR